MKIDIEGSEYPMLRGCDNRFKSGKKTYCLY